MNRRRTQNTETAIQALCRHNRQIDTYLNEIREALTERMLQQEINGGPEKTNWGHVGDAQHISGQLKNVADMLLQRDEYAS